MPRFSAMPNWMRRVGTSIAGSLAGEFFKIWILPPIGTGIGVVIGWLQGYPLFYLYVGGVFLFASLSAGLLYFSGWRAMNRVEHKLTLLKVRHKPIFHASDDSIIAMQFGFNLNNSAPYPIQFKVDDLRTILALQGTSNPSYSPNIEREDSEYTVAPHSTAFFDDYRIPVPPSFVGLARVQLHCTLSYGKSGRLHYKLPIKKMAIFNFRDNTVMGGRDWYDE